MASYSWFGAAVVPHHALDPYVDREPELPHFLGQSKSGWLQASCKALLDLFKGHEALRFFSGEQPTRTTHDPQDVSTLLSSESIPEVLRQLDELLMHCAANAVIVTVALQLNHRGDGPGEVHRALSEALTDDGIPATLTDHDEGDSATFLFMALVSTRSLLRYAANGSFRVVVFNYLP